MSEKETETHTGSEPPAADDRSRRRRFGHAAVVLELLPGDRHPRGSDPRLRPQSPAVRHRPPGRQGQPADRHELLHGQAAPHGPGHDHPAARGDLRLDRARRPPPRHQPSPSTRSPAASAPRASSSEHVRHLGRSTSAPLQTLDPTFAGTRPGDRPLAQLGRPGSSRIALGNRRNSPAATMLSTPTSARAVLSLSHPISHRMRRSRLAIADRRPDVDLDAGREVRRLEPARCRSMTSFRDSPEALADRGAGSGRFRR